MMKRPWFLGAAVALATIALGVSLVLVVAASSGNDGENRTAGPVTKRTHTSSTSSARGSTTTTTTFTTTTTSPSTAAAGASAPTPPGTDPPDPPDPTDRYEPVPLPTGISGAISGCSWSPANGGELRANGTVTNIAGDDDVWLVTAVWLQHNQTQDEDFNQVTKLIEIAVGQTAPWDLTISQPAAPPNVSCALEVE